MTLEERIAKRKAEGWRLLCWVVKRDDRELGEQWLMDEEVKHGHWGMDSVFAKRFGPQNHIGAGVIASSHKGARAVPVFARTIKVKRGHDFAWALARMREGKRVTRPCWRPLWLSTSEAEPSYYLNDMTIGDLIATDWELAE